MYPFIDMGDISYICLSIPPMRRGSEKKECILFSRRVGKRSYCRGRGDITCGAFATWSPSSNGARYQRAWNSKFAVSLDQASYTFHLGTDKNFQRSSIV